MKQKSSAMSPEIRDAFRRLKLPAPDSHKGQNGKLLIIGGSELFHAASKWSLDVASKFVDMVFYSSVPTNNELIRVAKGQFWNGIVVPHDQVEKYIEEADCILIGPGMTRERLVDDRWREKLLQITQWSVEENDKGNPEVSVAKRLPNAPLPIEPSAELATEIRWDADTYAVTNYLVAKYPQKKWLIDAGALQMIEPALLNENMIITPHRQEIWGLERRYSDWVKQWEDREHFTGDFHIGHSKYLGGGFTLWDDFGWTDGSWVISDIPEEIKDQPLKDACDVSVALMGAKIVLKGAVDLVVSPELAVPIFGGHPGMTKGGTGDVLAGLVAALYCTNDALTSAIVGSYVNKKAGEALAEKVGPFFNASDLVSAIPQALWQAYSSK